MSSRLSVDFNLFSTDSRRTCIQLIITVTYITADHIHNIVFNNSVLKQSMEKIKLHIWEVILTRQFHIILFSYIKYNMDSTIYKRIVSKTKLRHLYKYLYILYMPIYMCVCLHVCLHNYTTNQYIVYYI